MSKNLATTTVAVAPSPATSGTTLTVAAGTGARLFVGSAVIHPSDAVPTPVNAEVVVVTDTTGDVVTLTRAQESSTARTVGVGDVITQGITAAMWDGLVASNAGKAAASHVHAAADVTSGILPLARGGTGGADAATARTSLGLGTAAVMSPAQIAADPAVTATYAPKPAGTPTVGQVPVVTTASPLALGWGSLSQSGKGMKRDYAAVGDMKVVTDATVTAASTTLATTASTFVAGDVGKTVAIPYAGADNGTAAIGETHMTTIAAYVSGTQVTLSAAPVKGIAGPRTVTDAAINANSATLNSAAANWTSADVGKTISIPNAGRAILGSTTAPLVAKIVTRVSATQVTVFPPAATTVSAKTVAIPGAWVGYGTNDTAAFQAAAAAGGSIEIEPGRYLTTGEITQGSRTTWWGYGAGRSIINYCGTGGSAFRYQGPPQIEDVTYRDFEIDGSGCRVKTYGTVNKGLYIVDCKRLTITGMYVHDTSATAVGCDYLPDAVCTGNIVERGGAQVPEGIGASGGGSGFGIGTGRYAIESVYIAGNVVRWCGYNGIFSESQSNTVRSRGIRFIGNYVEDCGFGISDRACDGTIIASNQVVGIVGVGIHVGQGFSAPLNSVNTQIVDNVVHGVSIQLRVRDGDHSIRGNQVIGTVGAAAIEVEPVAGGSLGTLTIEGNQVQDAGNLCRGVWLRGAVTWSRIIVQRNTIKNNSTSAALRPAILSEESATAMYVRDNLIWDDRGVSSGMSHGLQLTAGTIPRLVYDGNDIMGAVTAADDLTGATITTQVTHFNP